MPVPLQLDVKKEMEPENAKLAETDTDLKPTELALSVMEMLNFVMETEQLKLLLLAESIIFYKQPHHLLLLNAQFGMECVPTKTLPEFAQLAGELTLFQRELVLLQDL